MKSFIDICKMEKMELKSYLAQFLKSFKYDVINEDGFLYAKGELPVLLVAHMDTVHKEQCKDIVNENGKISSPQGIGGDDRCGIFMIMNLVKEHKCSVLFCEDEEIGLIGAGKFAKTDYIKDLGVNFMVELDRKGSYDAVFYSCANKDFQDFVCEVTGYKLAYGSCSDISKLMPASKLCAVNLSCGYYNAHTLDEYVVYDEMMDTIDAVEALIKEQVDEPFIYEERKYTYPSYKDRSFFRRESVESCGGLDYYGNLFGMGSGKPKQADWKEDEVFDEYAEEYFQKDFASIAKNDKAIELEVIVTTIDTMEEESIFANGNTKAECWMNFFMDNPNICFNDIVDYCWS